MDIDDDAGGNFANVFSKIATRLQLTAYRNLPTPYPTVPLLAHYDIPFSHNTKPYRQTDDNNHTISMIVSTVS